MEEIHETYAEGGTRCRVYGKVYVCRHIVNSEKGCWWEIFCDCEMMRSPVYTSVQCPIEGVEKIELPRCPTCGGVYRSVDVPPERGEWQRTQLLCDCKDIRLYSTIGSSNL